MSGRMALVGAVVMLALLGGCSSGQQSAARRALDQRFVDGVKETATDISRFRSDSQVVKLGHASCDEFQANANIEQIAGLLERTAPTVPPGDIGAIIATAVKVLCPAYAGRLNPVGPGG